MKRSITLISLGMSLVISGGVAAQENGVVDANGPTISYGDLSPGPGTTVISAPGGTTGRVTATNGNAAPIGPGNASAEPGSVKGGAPGTSLLGPDGTYSVSDSPPSDVTVGDAGTYSVESEPPPEPVADTTTSDTSAPASTEAVATDSADLDGDNYPDAQEPDLGLDPTSIDSDGDGVADGDEINIYGTDPLTADSDGDGVSDGDELYNMRTDPLVWNEPSSGASDGTTTATVDAEPLAAESSSSGVAGDSDGDRLADSNEATIGTDPSNPDSDGDGYYDGDEVNLGSDPFDAASVPAT